MGVKLDLIGNARARLTAKGYELVRSAHVTGLDAVDGDLLLVMACLVPGMPQIGSRHPSISFMYLEEAIPTYVDRDSANVDLVYRSPEGTSPQDEEDAGGATIEVGASVEMQETYQDIFGNLLIVAYTNSDDEVQTPEVKQISILRPREQKIFTYTSAEDPSDLSRFYSGKVNSTSWARHDPGCLPRVWLCHSIIGRSNNNGVTFRITATFVRNETPPTENYDVVLAFTNPETGRPYPDVEDGNGQETFQMYPMVDFNALPF